MERGEPLALQLPHSHAYGRTTLPPSKKTTKTVYTRPSAADERSSPWHLCSRDTRSFSASCMPACRSVYVSVYVCLVLPPFSYTHSLSEIGVSSLPYL